MVHGLKDTAAARKNALEADRGGLRDAPGHATRRMRSRL